MINILVTGTGGGVGQSIIKALHISKIDCRIISTDSNPLAVGIYRGDSGYLIPTANSPNFIDTIIDICEQESIDVIFIGSDPELPYFAANKNRIEEKTGTKVVVSSPEVIKIGYDKWMTYRFLRENNLPYPRSSLPEKMYELIDEVNYPIIIKPRTGSASRDVFLAKNEEELKIFIKRVDNPIVQEYLKPEEEEYTSGAIVFGDDILGVITMKRELKCGSTYRAFIDDYEIVRSAVINAAKLLKPFGPSNFQMRVTERGPVIFEINPRFSGTTALRAGAGFNEPEAVINYILFDKTSQMDYQRGLIALRYWNEIYIPSEYYLKLRTDKVIKDPCSRMIDYF